MPSSGLHVYVIHPFIHSFTPSANRHAFLESLLSAGTGCQGLVCKSEEGRRDTSGRA